MVDSRIEVEGCAQTPEDLPRMLSALAASAPKAMMCFVSGEARHDLWKSNSEQGELRREVVGGRSEHRGGGGGSRVGGGGVRGQLEWQALRQLSHTCPKKDRMT
eukprot:468723-Rhodomonas_salina.1